MEGKYLLIILMFSNKKFKNVVFFFLKSGLFSFKICFEGFKWIDQLVVGYVIYKFVLEVEFFEFKDKFGFIVNIFFYLIFIFKFNYLIFKDFS